MKSTFQNCGPRTAVVVLCVFSLLTGTLFVSSLTAKLTHVEASEGDIALYEAIVERIRHGENYYDADGTELRARGFGVRPVFHWRTPLHLMIVAALPDSLPSAILLVLSIILCALAVRGQAIRIQLVGGAALIMIFIGMPASAILAEAWIGVLIAISAHVYDSHRKTAIGLAVLALFLRELAAIYIGVCILNALFMKDWRELGVWTVVLTAYAAYYGWHVGEVLERTLTSDRYEMEWGSVGGIKSVITTSRFFGVILLGPAVVAAMFLVAALLGTLARPAHRVLKVSAVAYLLLCFTVAKNPQNGYWGLIYCGLVAPGILWLLPALRDLWSAIRLPSNA